jgi:hypothetical protein
VRSSTPVPTSGAEGFRSGMAWRCMLEPYQRAIGVVVLQERDRHHESIACERTCGGYRTSSCV